MDQIILRSCGQLHTNNAYMQTAYYLKVCAANEHFIEAIKEINYVFKI